MRHFFKPFMFALAFACTFSFVSCGDDNELPEPNNPTPVEPVTPSEKEAMSPEAQKQYLDKVAMDFMAQMPASDFEEIASLGKWIADTYVDDYDWDNVEDWAEDVFDAARQALGTETTNTKTYQDGRYTEQYNYIFTNYSALLTASNFIGHFTAKNGQWELTPANDLQFIFPDKAGRQCIVKLETSGKEKKVHAFNIDDTQNSEYSSSDDYTYIRTRYYDRTQYTVAVPEKIVVTLTQGGSQVVKTTVNIDLNSLTGEEFDISKNNITVSTTTELNNGYKIVVNQVAYTANSKASGSCVMSKNGTNLVTVAFSGDISGIPSCNVAAFSCDDFDEDDYDWESANGKNAFVKVDVMGKLQIQGTISDVHKYVDYLDDADHNDTEESKFKSYINQANSLTNVFLFYDGSATKQAEAKLEPFIDETWNGKTYWKAEPIMCFFDGSSYSTFEAFFNEEDFKKVIDTFKALANNYANLIDEKIEW